jgi:hypothetical protein
MRDAHADVSPRTVMLPRSPVDANIGGSRAAVAPCVPNRATIAYHPATR